MERTDLEYRSWQMGQSRTDSQNVVDVLMSAYRLQAPPTTSVVSASFSSATRAMTAGLSGLIVGLLLAVGREWMRRSRAGARG
ncbi:MAG: hypothetical protein Q7W30_07570 [Coriobacteriia bacterium]|nr:hypothetical protein [Coriobacteriia bacterium]